MKLIAIIIAVIIVATAGFYIYSNDNSVSIEDLKANAIKQAQEYEPGNCLDVVTPATHIETGAKYTFSSSCVAPGWESDR
jgi:uncharacterized protein YxeA